MLIDNLVLGNDALMTIARSRPKRGAARPVTAVGSEGVTLWRQIADDVEREIVSGVFEAGDRLPGELELAARFDVNRHTVRRALSALTERGLVRAARGSGTFVEAGRLAYPIGSRTRFSEIVGAAGREPGGRLIASAIEPASPDVARRLKLASGTPVVRLDMLRHADGEPVCTSICYLPAARFPDAARAYAVTRSMTGMLARFGVHDYRRQSTRVTAAIADALVAERLELVPGRAVLVVESVDTLPEGEPIVTKHTKFAADRVELVFDER